MASRVIAMPQRPFPNEENYSFPFDATEKKMIVLIVTSSVFVIHCFNQSKASCFFSA